MKSETEHPRRDSAKQRLRAVLRDEVAGKRTSVLVLGDGMNAHASGRLSAGSWHRLLGGLWRLAGGVSGTRPYENLSAPAAWTMIVHKWMTNHRVSYRTANIALRRLLQQQLSAMEQRTRPHALYASLLDGRFANVISFSVDRRFILQSGAHRVAERGSPDTLGMRYDVHGERGRTTVWYPYGHTGREHSISLGQGNYDLQLRRLELARASLMDANNDWDAGFGPGLRSPFTVYGRQWAKPNSWAALMLCAPLVIIGASLPVDDWPLWWLLHQRARYFVPFEAREQTATFYLTVRGAPDEHLVNEPAGIERVIFPNHSHLWTFVQSAVEGRGRDQHAWARRRYD